jgi:hypothetical protein
MSPIILPKVDSSYRSGVDDASTFVSGGMTLILERQAVVFSHKNIGFGSRKPAPEFPEQGANEMSLKGSGEPSQS